MPVQIETAGILLEEVPVPPLRGNTNADLVQWVLDLRQALETANAVIRTARRGLDGRKEAAASAPDS